MKHIKIFEDFEEDEFDDNDYLNHDREENCGPCEEDDELSDDEMDIPFESKKNGFKSITSKKTGISTKKPSIFSSKSSRKPSNKIKTNEDLSPETYISA